MSSPTLRISDVATAAGVNVETLRYYERRGILPRARRNGPLGYRQYTRDTVEIVRFIKRAQSLGFSLDEIEELLLLRRPGRERRAKARRSAHAMIDRIDVKLASLATIQAALGRLVSACGESAGVDASFLGALAETEAAPSCSAAGELRDVERERLRR
jgi:DNA-binding transcriptional MerR regulator